MIMNYSWDREGGAASSTFCFFSGLSPSALFRVFRNCSVSFFFCFFSFLNATISLRVVGFLGSCGSAALLRFLSTFDLALLTGFILGVGGATVSSAASPSPLACSSPAGCSSVAVWSSPTPESWSSVVSVVLLFFFGFSLVSPKKHYQESDNRR